MTTRKNSLGRIYGIFCEYQKKKAKQNLTKKLKQKTRIIEAPKDAKYLGDFLQTLPPNTFINKVTTGVGATTMALESPDKYIIAVPYQSLADNKKKWCEERGIDILVVQSGVTKQEIENFTGLKILVVFDSLWKLTKNLKNRETYRLMIDEVHVILTSALFRGKGMNTVLNHFTKFKDFVLITATPTPILYSLKEFKNIEKIEIKWQGLKKINFVRDVVTKDDGYCVADKLILLSRQHLDGKINSNAYFFVNSVSIINLVVKALVKQGLVTPNEVNLIVAKGNSARLKVNLGKSFAIGEPPTSSNTAKKLNFITSTAFEGSDFYDENGKIYIISDGTNSHTKIDILTQLHQISGRIRDSKLNDSIQIITVPNFILDFEVDRKTFESKTKAVFNLDKEYLQSQKKIIKDKSKNDSLCEKIGSKLLEEAEINSCYIEDNGFVQMNELYIPSQMHHWEVLNQSYVYGYDNEGDLELIDGNNCGINFIDRKVELPPLAIGKALLGKDYNFRKLMIMYLEARKEEDAIITQQVVEGTYSEENSLSVQIGKIEPLIPKAYRILKPKGLASLNYSKPKIREAIEKNAPINNVAKYVKIKPGWYSNRDIKERLQKYYDTISSNLKAKSTDIFRYYVAESKSKRVLGKLVRGVEIRARIRLEKKKK